MLTIKIIINSFLLTLTLNSSIFKYLLCILKSLLIGFRLLSITPFLITLNHVKIDFF